MRPGRTRSIGATAFVEAGWCKSVLSKAFAVTLIASLSMGSVVPALAQDGWRVNGISVKDHPNMASSGDFGVLQIATDDPNRLMADWEKPTPGVSVASITEIPRNKPVVTFVVFKGCHPDAAGNCNVTADFETTSPSGKSYDRTKSAQIWVGYPPATDNSLQLSQAGYGLIFEDKDAVGTYRVDATITDHISGTSLHTSQVLTVIAK